MVREYLPVLWEELFDVKVVDKEERCFGNYRKVLPEKTVRRLLAHELTHFQLLHELHDRLLLPYLLKAHLRRPKSTMCLQRALWWRDHGFGVDDAESVFVDSFLKNRREGPIPVNAFHLLRNGGCDGWG